MVSVNAHKRCCHMYESLSDEEIVQLARDTDDEALEHLINKYKNFVRAKARSYFLIGADRKTSSKRA